MKDSSCKTDGLSCALIGKDFQNRRAEILKSFRLLDPAMSEIQLGYKFVFQSDSDQLSTIFDFVAYERKCCPFLEFSVHCAPENGPITLTIKAPEAGMEFLKGLFVGLRPGESV